MGFLAFLGTAVGTAIGGPIGGTIGGTLGKAVEGGGKKSSQATAVQKKEKDFTGLFTPITGGTGAIQDRVAAGEVATAEVFDPFELASRWRGAVFKEEEEIF